MKKLPGGGCSRRSSAPATPFQIASSAIAPTSVNASHDKTLLHAGDFLGRDLSAVCMNALHSTEAVPEKTSILWIHAHFSVSGKLLCYVNRGWLSRAPSIWEPRTDQSRPLERIHRFQNLQTQIRIDTLMRQPSVNLVLGSS